MLGAQLLVRARALHRTSSSSERASVGALILAGRRKQPRASPAQLAGSSVGPMSFDAPHVRIKMSSGTRRKNTPSARLSATTSENILVIPSSNTSDSTSPRHAERLRTRCVGAQFARRRSAALGLAPSRGAALGHDAVTVTTDWSNVRNNPENALRHPGQRAL